ncbi:MAG: hypothetical protein AAGC99_13030 [Pseudomonadota bacterium]
MANLLDSNPVQQNVSSAVNMLLNTVDEHQAAVVALATIVIAATSIATVIMTAALIRENRLLRKAGSMPSVVAYLAIDQRYTRAINFVLANVGQGPARKVKFSFDGDQDNLRARGIDIANQATREPVGMLPQGEQIVLFLGMGPNLLGKPMLKPFVVSLDYEDLKGRRYKSEHSLDVSQFDGFSRLGSPPEHEIAESLKTIAGVVKGFGFGGSQRLRVETVTSAEVAERHRNALEAQRRARADAPQANDCERD